MGRIDDFIAVIRDGTELSGNHVRDGLLRRLVVHMACRDGVIEKEEASALARVFPGLDRETLEGRVAALSEEPLDMDQLVAAFEEADRPKLLELAQHVARVDDALVGKELGALLALRNAVYD